jgi:hypothetical protein
MNKIFHKHADYFCLFGYLKALLATSFSTAVLFWATLAAQASTLAELNPNPNPTITLSFPDRVFHIPYIYISPRPPLSTLKPNNPTTRFGVAFWMPDGSPVSDDPAWNPGFRPHQTGETPSADHFITQVTSIISASDVNSAPDPKIQLSNLLRYEPNYWKVTHLNSHEELIETVDYNSKQFHYYYGFTQSGDTYFVRCLHHPSDVNPGCDGSLRIYRYNLDAHVMLPEDQQRKINVIASKFSELLAMWTE